MKAGGGAGREGEREAPVGGRARSLYRDEALRHYARQSSGDEELELREDGLTGWLWLAVVVLLLALAVVGYRFLGPLSGT